MICKKFVLSILIFTISLSTAAGKPNYTYTMNPTPASAYSGTYVNEEITVPITQIGIPEEYMNTQIEETGMEIAWNQWHADVRNNISSYLQKADYPGVNYVIRYVFTVDINKNISNIVIFYIPETAFTNITSSYLKINADLYMYVNDTGKFYKLNPIKSIHYSNAEDRLKNSTISEIEQYKVPYFVLFEKMARSLQKAQGKKFLTFPENTKRTSVVVEQGITNITARMKNDKFTANEFNDIERW